MESFLPFNLTYLEESWAKSHAEGSLYLKLPLDDIQLQENEMDKSDWSWPVVWLHLYRPVAIATSWIKLLHQMERRGEVDCVFT